MITDDQVAELFAEANPIPTLTVLDTDAVVDDGLQDSTSERSRKMVTVETERRGHEKWRPPAVVAALGVALVSVVSLAILLTGGEQADVATPVGAEPIETVQAWIDRFESGDVEGFQSLMAVDTMYSCTFEGALVCEEPQAYFGGSTAAAEDARASRLTYVADGSLGADCSVDGSDVTCHFDRTNLFHEIGGVDPVEYTYVFTVEDGIITAVVDERPRFFLPQLPIGQYQRWVQDRYPDEHDELFFSTTMLFETEDQVDRHRELVAEWAATEDS